MAACAQRLQLARVATPVAPTIICRVKISVKRALPLWWKKKQGYLLLGFLILVALAARLLPGERIIDDAYITFRYARNIAGGRGFVYNQGEHVLGTTTPLYTLILAGLAKIIRSSDFPSIAVLTNAVAGALSVGLLYALGKRLVGHWAAPAAAALLWALAPFSVTFAVGGMETDLVVTLLLASAYAYVVDASYALAVLSSLALLVRPDTALLLVLLWLGLIVRRRRLPFWEVATAVAVLAPWLVFAVVVFGSPVPGSLVAKSAAYRLPPTAALVRLIQHYSTPFLAHTLLGSGWQLFGFVFYLALVSVGGIHVLRRLPHAWPLLIYPYAYLITFAAANPLLFRWYLSPPLPFYFLLILSGVWYAGSDIVRALRWRSRNAIDSVPGPNTALMDRDPDRSTSAAGSVPLAALAALALITTLNAWELHPDHGPDRPAPQMAWFELELLYTQAAEFVLDGASPDDCLCAGDIGTLGYHTRLPICDTVGLVTPESRRYYPADPEIYAINYAIPAQFVLDAAPDWLVILEVYGRKGLLRDANFLVRYRLVGKLPTDVYDSNGMLVYARRE